METAAERFASGSAPEEHHAFGATRPSSEKQSVPRSCSCAPPAFASTAIHYRDLQPPIQIQLAKKRKSLQRVRAHWWKTAVDRGFHAPDSGGPEACRQEQSRYPASVASAGISLALCALLGRVLGWLPAFCELPRRDCGGEPLRRQGRRPRVFGLAGFKPAPTKTRASVASASQLRAAAAHRRACAALTNTRCSAVCAVDAAFEDLADTALCAP